VTQFDATTLQYTVPDGSTGTLTDNGGCSFATADGSTVLWSKSGFAAIVAARSNGNPPALVFGMPEQDVALSELAGTWNYVAYLADLTVPVPALSPSNGYFTLDGAGRTSANFACVNLDPCSDAGPVPDLVPAAGGGFLRNTAGGPDAYYVFKTESGRYVMAGVVSNASRFGYFVATLQVARSLPAVGDITLSRSLTVDGQLAVSPIADNTYTVLSVDAGAQSFTRQRQQDGRMETLDVNSPRSGLMHRLPGAAAPIIVMPLPGNAASVFTSADAAHNFLGVSIQHP
jgi:hypothetical protein